VLNYIELSENQFISLYKYHRLNKYNVLQIKLSELLFQDDYADNVPNAHDQTYTYDLSICVFIFKESDITLTPNITFSHFQYQ
jgi:hypothetical protein